jgi:putative CocE/NonD family hydrolase
MRTVTDFPCRTRFVEYLAIPMRDGLDLAAALWLPEDAAANPVPAILEHLPYRRRDGTVARDRLTHPDLAGHGYACLRTDLRGSGDTDGVLTDEYTPQELHDAVDAIAWIAAQPWCSGAVGMMGISWGGFNALQVAALRPPALEAIVTLCSTDDRYADDIHFKGGALLGENFGWGATMFSYSSRPPDPLIVGDRWRAMWLERLDANPMLHARWLEHPTRDAFWRHGSVCEDWGAIEAATLAIGGWNDAYKNAVPRIVANLKAPAKGILGPWIHKYPHIAKPEPAGFLQEALRWWDRWLKGLDTGVDSDPAMRLFLMDSARPATWYENRSGTWIAEPAWPSPRIAPETWYLGPGTLGAPAAFTATVASLATCGLMGGEYCAMHWGPELPGDQRRDDALSACFDSPPLDAPRAVVGAPVVHLTLTADRPVAQIAVRLCDLHPDGASTRITWGVLNLAHRDGHTDPRPLVPGAAVTLRLQLDDIAYAVPAGHRLRFAVSTAYWPMIWPAPAPVTLTLTAGRLDLPVRPLPEGPETALPPPEAAPPWPHDVLRPASNRRVITEDQATGLVTLEIDDDFGEMRDRDHGLTTGSRLSERWSIHPDDPLSARAEARWTQTLARGDWSVRTEAETTMTSDATTFRITGRLTAFEGERQVFVRDHDRTIPRGLL